MPLFAARAWALRRMAFAFSFLNVSGRILTMSFGLMSGFCRLSSANASRSSDASCCVSSVYSAYLPACLPSGPMAVFSPRNSGVVSSRLMAVSVCWFRFAMKRRSASFVFEGSTFFVYGARKVLRYSSVWVVSVSFAVCSRALNIVARAVSRFLGGGWLGWVGLMVSRFRPFCRKNRVSCIVSVGLRIHVLRLLMCRAPERCASAMSLGSMFRSVYSLKTVCPAASSGFVVCVWGVVCRRLVTSWTGIPRRVSLFRYSSRPFSMRMAFTTSLMSGAVRYLVLDLRSCVSASLATFCACSGGIFASFMRAFAILLASNSSIADLLARMSMFLGLVAFLSILSATSMTILPRSVREYFFWSTMASMRSALRRNFRW